MVWFQCEVCGEELKKPKLPNHFRQCPSYKLSCLDCGVTFDKQTVQSHTQCISEAEKYGPKGQNKPATGTPAKPTKDKPKPDVDTNVGLSNRPPWFCSLCNTQATSKQALLLHADGKKHRAKARAFAAKNQPAQAPALMSKDSAENITKTEILNGRTEIDKKTVASNEVSGHDIPLPENGDLSAKKKRKKDGLINEGLGDEDATQAKVQNKVKKAKHDPDMKGGEREEAIREVVSEDEGSKVGAKKECSKEKIKWKKLIISALKSASNGALKMKKLRKLVYKSLRESGTEMDDSELKTILKDKINSSSKFIVDGKSVRLAV